MRSNCEELFEANIMIATSSRIEWAGRAYLNHGHGPVNATLGVDNDNLSLTSTVGTINMTTGTVSRIERAGWLRRGILIHHHSRHQVFRFVPANGTIADVLNQLKELGYWVVL